jgi:protein TonB
MRLRVDARGIVSECTIDRGTGQPAIDTTLCNLAYERLRFRPALNRSGQAVAGWFGYAQPAPR